jgi:hypothetical protein
MEKKRKPIKVKWEWVSTPDAEERLRAAFDIIFSGMAEPRTGLSSPDKHNPESQEGCGQLPLF